MCVDFLCVTSGRCIITLDNSDRDGPDSKSAIICKEMTQRQKMLSEEMNVMQWKGKTVDDSVVYEVHEVLVFR